MLALIALITFVLLVRTFRSLLLPIKAVLLNLVSLSAVFGSVVFFWQMGHGSDAIFSVSATGAITFWLPVIIFAFLFGLSMDYEVFILARMREEYDATGSTAKAVVTGLGRTGRLVTSAALILFFAFAALASSPGTDIKVLGHRARRRHPDRRHPGPGPARARPGQRVRPLELVAAGLAGPALRVEPSPLAPAADPSRTSPTANSNASDRPRRRASGPAAGFPVPAAGRGSTFPR